MFSWFRKAKPDIDGRLPAEWLGVLQQNVWQYRWLPAERRERLHQVVAAMVARRRWEGGGGLEVTEEMKVTVAGVAALLTLGYDELYTYEKLPSIVMYPTGYSTPEGDRLGEAWHRGPIVLSWVDTLSSARRAGRGNNLVLHEFAHHVDGLDGEMDGRPSLAHDARRRWERVIHLEYDRLVARSRRSEVTLLDHYGASNHAEFFAVSTECFFERPHDMKGEHPELFELLGGFYQQDPTEWSPPAHRLARRRDVAKQTVAFNPDVSDLGLNTNDAAFTLGHELLRVGQHREAIAAFDRALQSDPDDTEALTLRSAAHLSLDQHEAALQDALRAIENDPEQALARAAAAEALIELGEDDAARPHALAALRLEKDSVDALFFCGTIALRAGRVREALRHLKRLVAFDRYWDEAHYWLGCAYEASGNQEAAKRHFDRANWLAAQPVEEEEAEESASDSPSKPTPTE